MDFWKVWKIYCSYEIDILVFWLIFFYDLGKKMVVCKLFILYRSCIWVVILIIRVREIMIYILDLWVIILIFKKNIKWYRVYFIFKWNNLFFLSYGGCVWKNRLFVSYENFCFFVYECKINVNFRYCFIV